MNLFDALLGAANDPDRQASFDQMGDLIGRVQQMSGANGMDAATTQAVLSMVGNAVQSGLQNHSQVQGPEATQELVNQLSGNGFSAEAMTSLIPPEMQSQVAGAIARQTGLDASLIQMMLPNLVPVVLNLIQGGALKDGAGSNPLLNMFLDSNRDGNLDVGDAMNLAMQFMQNR